MLGVLGAFSSLMLGAQVYAETADEEVDPTAVKALIKEWVETERLATEEGEGWKFEKSSMQELIQLYETELALIKEELDAAGEATVETDQKVEGLKDELGGLKKQRSELTSIVDKQVKRLLVLKNSFPEPLEQQVVADLAVLEESESSLRDKLVAMVSVLKAVGKFDSVVSYTDMVQEVGDSKRQMRVIYLGLAQAYYVSGKTGGVGYPTAKGWMWEEREGSEAAISRAIAVFQKTSRPELITLPVEVHSK